MINQVTLVGRLTKDPELKVTPDGTYVLNIILAVNRHYRNTHGEIDTDFVQCTLWKKAAENTAQYCRKGAVLGITGRIHTRHYDNTEGKRVYVTEVVAESVRFLSSKPADAARQAAEPAVNQSESARAPIPENQPYVPHEKPSFGAQNAAMNQQTSSPEAPHHPSLSSSQHQPNPFDFERPPSGQQPETVRLNPFDPLPAAKEPDLFPGETPPSEKVFAREGLPIG